MTATPKELYKAAMELDPKDRAELTGLLLESLEIHADTGVEAAWLREIEERLEAIDSANVETVSWTEVKSRVFEPRAR